MSREPTEDLESASDGETVAAVSVAVLSGAAVLLVRRGREPSKGLWAFPGGRVEPGETDEQAAAREAFEETGLVVSDLTEFQTVTIAREGSGSKYRLRVFTTRSFQGDPVAGDDAEAMGWFGPDDVTGLPMARSMAEAVRVLLGR